MRKFILASMLMLAPFAASAEHIASFLTKLDPKTVLEFEMHTLAYDFGECSKVDGAKKLDVVAYSMMNRGDSELMGSGCWKQKDGQVLLLAQGVDDAKWRVWEIPVEQLLYTHAFTSWDEVIPKNDLSQPDTSTTFASMQNSYVKIVLGSEEVNCFGRSGRKATATELTGDDVTYNGCWSMNNGDVVFISHDKKKMLSYSTSHFIETRWFTGWSNP